MSDGKKASHTIEAMSDDDLRKFVDGAVSGRLFTSVQVTNGMLMSMVFMPIAMGAFEGWTEEELSKLGVIWEWMDQAGPRSINGMPIFMSMRLMSKDDWTRALNAILAEQERRKTITV